MHVWLHPDVHLSLLLPDLGAFTCCDPKKLMRLIPVALPSQGVYWPKPPHTLRTVLPVDCSNTGVMVVSPTYPSMAKHNPKIGFGGDSQPHPPALHLSSAPMSTGHIRRFPPVASH